jgi:hypothetical protein
MSRFEPRAVICYLTLKNISVAEIATELQSVYDRDTLKYSTVPQWRPGYQDGSDDLFDLAPSGESSRSDLAPPIQSLLQQFTFISCNVLCRKLMARVDFEVHPSDESMPGCDVAKTQQYLERTVSDTQELEEEQKQI